MFHPISFLTYAVITAVTPGPNNLMSMSNAGRLGFRRALPFNVGILAGFSMVMFICTFLSSVLSSTLPLIKTPMLILGAGYMLFLAWKTYRSTSNVDAGIDKIEEKSKRNTEKSKVSSEKKSDKSNTKGGFVSGLTLQFVNPKIYIYGIISMEAYILPAFHGQGIALFFFALLLAMIGFIATLGWSLFGSLFKILFSKHAKVTNTIMALLLVYCAISLFFE